MLDKIQAAVNFYMTHFSFVDYFGLLWVLLLFLAVLFLVMVLVVRRPIFASFLLFFDIFLLAGGIYFSHKIIDENVRKREIAINYIKELSFSPTLILDFNLTNLSNNPFYYCGVEAKIFKSGGNVVMDFLNSLSPFRVKNESVGEQIDIGQTQIFHMVFKDFSPNFEYKYKIKSECF